MGYVIQAVLSNAQHPEYGQITMLICGQWLDRSKAAFGRYSFCRTM